MVSITAKSQKPLDFRSGYHLTLDPDLRNSVKTFKNSINFQDRERKKRQTLSLNNETITIKLWTSMICKNKIYICVRFEVGRFLSGNYIPQLQQRKKERVREK